MSNLTPDYRDIDFQTMVERLRTLLSNTDTFKDYDFEGANITILMELVSYVGDLNTYLTNKLAQNIHTDTANIYEVVHSLVRQQGHEPSGYIGSELVADFRVYMEDVDQTEVFFQEGDELSIPQWFRIDTGQTSDDGEVIYYILTEPYVRQIDAADVVLGYADIQLTLRQGELNPPISYTGENIVSNQIVLPFQNWDMSTYPYDESPISIQVTVGDDETAWTRINDFFDDISGLVEEDDAYMLLYDKYERSVLTFSNTRNIPELTDPIIVYLIETLGLGGALSADTWSVDDTTDPTRWVQVNGTVPDTDTILDVEDVDFITNTTNVLIGKIPTTQYVMYNDSGSAGGSNPQSIDELKNAGKAAAHAQQRNVTKKDYIGNLERRGDITVANAWGEQEESPDTLILENYNKAYIAVIPTEWDNGNDDNILLDEVVINNDFSRNTDAILEFPTEYTLENVYNPSWEDELLTYIEPRKMLGIYEYFVLPELVHFRMDFGLKVKRSYNWVQVKETVRNKLAYYFLNSNREFGELVDFREIVEFILDTNQVSPTDNFDLVRGVQYLTTRDIMTYRDAGLLETVDTQEACEFMDGGWAYGVSSVNVFVEDLVGSLGTGWYYDVPTTTTIGEGTGCTLDIEIIPGPIVNTVNINSAGSQYELDDEMIVDATYFGATSGTLRFVVTGVDTSDGSCDLDSDIDEMYIYPENIYNYFPHYVELGYVQNSADTTYNDLQPIQLGFKQFPQIAIDLCVFTNEG